MRQIEETDQKAQSDLQNSLNEFAKILTPIKWREATLRDRNDLHDRWIIFEGEKDGADFRFRFETSGGIESMMHPKFETSLTLCKL